MVCIPCIFIPVFLWIFHRFLRPYVLDYIPWFKTKEVEDVKKSPRGIGEGDSASVAESNSSIKKFDDWEKVQNGDAAVQTSEETVAAENCTPVQTSEESVVSKKTD